MSDAKGNQEPSMEEILASIRRIISEDGEPKDESAPAANGHAGEDDDDALVLTDMVVGESNVVELQEETPAPPSPPEPEPEPAPVAAMPEPAPVPEPEPEPAPEPEHEVAPTAEAEPEPAEVELEEEPAASAPSGSSSADDGFPAVPADTPVGPEPVLVSPDVAAASAATMAQLMARKAEATMGSRHQSLDGLLVETLVRQAIEPMLKHWLDEHLQEIVERLVRREVERLSRKAELS